MRVAFLLAAFTLLAINQSFAQDTEEAAVLKVDEEYRLAKLKNDTSTMDRIFADGFHQMNQNGNGRNKMETIELWKTFRISSLTTDSSHIEITGNTAVVRGTQTEVNGTGTDLMLFTRVYVNADGRWRLLSSTQFRNPKLYRIAMIPWDSRVR